MSVKLMLKNVRLSYPHLFKAVDYKNNKNFRYGATFFVTPGSDNDKAIRAAISEEMKAVHGAKAEKMEKYFMGIPQQCAYKDGDLSGKEETEGVWTLTAHTTTRPTVIDKDAARSPLTQEDGKPYAGCFVNARVDIWVQTGETPGIRCALAGVQFWKDGEAFGSGGAASPDEFDTFEDDDDDIPL